jgi:excisionase family DNA binding protein
MPVEKYVNTNEAAELIGCTVGRVRQLLRDEELTGIKANARAWLIPRRQVLQIARRPYTTGRPRVSQSS